ncbi:MAG TPA: restriction endonuclease [Candidatus Obscuribacterales bacterium]
MTRKILILAANPKTTSRLRLDEEVREIDDGLYRARHRDQFELVQRWAVRPRDIHRAMLEINPQIVHFAGHGAGEEGLIFEDETGQPKFVMQEALAGLFKLFADQVECVVLNGCYSQVQAEVIAQHIPYVIGMQQTIGDRAAIAFAVGFYDALGAGRPFEFAYKLGCNAIQMEGTPEHLTPILVSTKRPQSIEIESSSSEQSSLISQHEYELLVKDILQSRLIENIPGKDLEIQQNAHYKGKSGYEHRIGLSALMKIAGVKFLILVECKNHSRLVEASEVLEFASRLDDIGAQKGIIVTTRGFHSGALQVAKSKGIALVIACDLDWEICLESPTREISLRQDFIQKCVGFLSRSNKLNKTSLLALYDQSAESMRGVTRKFASLLEASDDSNSRRSWRIRGGNGEDSLPHGYIFINDSIGNRDVELERFSYEDQFLTVRRDGLFSYISIDLATNQKGKK